MTINNHEAKHRLIDKWLVANGPWASRGAVPTDGVSYKDNDRGGMEFRYNATVGQWLSTQLFSHPIRFMYDGSVNATYPTVLPTPTRAFATASLPRLSLMPEDLYLRLWQAVAGSGTIFYTWVFAPFGLQAGTVAVARDTKTIPSSNWTGYLYTRDNNNFVTMPATPAIDPTNFDFQVTGATGKLLMDGVFRYRLVG